MKDNLLKKDNNEFPDISVYNNESISKIKSLLSQDLSKQEKYIKMIKTSIMNTNSGKKESLSKLNQMLEMFSEIVRFIGITFCEIIKKDEKFLEEMFKLLLNKKMKKKCEQIFFNIIQIYNFSSQRKNFGDVIRDRIAKSYANFSFPQKRDCPTEIELFVDEINALFEEANGPNNKEKMVAIYNALEEMENKLNCLCATNKYFPSTLDYLHREINNLKNIFSLLKNQILQINNGENCVNQTENIFDENQENHEDEKQINDGNIFVRERIILNDIFYEHQVKQESKIPLEKRTFFFHKEKLVQGEDQFTEFKDYSFPLIQYQKDEIIRQYLGFLNSEGGRIYLGISDSKEVIGMMLKYKDRDAFSRTLVGYTKDFYPSVRVDKIRVVYIPIKYPQTGELISDLFIVKIIVRKGDQRFLYAMDNPKQGMISAMRKQTEVLNLKAKEIQDEIIRRSQLEKRWADILTNLTVYNDPEPNIIENINSDEEEEKNDQSSDVGMKLMKRCQYILKISNIDKNLRPKDLNRFFNDCGRKAQRFKGRDGKNFGEGILIFDNEETAKGVMRKLEGSNLGGKNEVTLKLVKSEYFYDLAKC